MKNFLKEIVSLKKREVEALKIKRPITDFVDSRRLLKGVRHFGEAVLSGSDDRINLIAEIKKKSPSRKTGFSRKFDIGRLAELYAEGGVIAISVLTDKKFFGGNISHISDVRRAVNLPVLRKDFIIDEYQVYESRYFGADAILLIARILAKEQIKSFIHFAKRIGMDAIVEIHDENDLEKALVADAKMIGINNRDLDTLKVDLKNTFRLVRKMPKEIIKISESGIKTSDDISRLRDIGVNAVLIGEAFLEAEDINSRIRDIIGGDGR